MTRDEVALLSLRLLVIYVWYEALQHCFLLARLLARVSEGIRGPEEPLGVVLGILLLVLFGWVLQICAPAIAQSIFPGRERAAGSSTPEFGTLAFKLCGFLVLASFVRDLGNLPYYLHEFHDEYRRATADAELLLLAARGAVAAALLRAAPWLARRLRGAPAAGPDASMLARVQPVAFSVLGLFLAAPALERAAERVAIALYLTGEWDPWPLASDLAICALGLVLFAGAASLGRFWHWLQVAGLNGRHGAR